MKSFGAERWCRERDLNPRPSDDSGISKGAYGVNVPFGCPMSPTRYQLRHPGSKSVERQLPFEYNRRTNEVFRELVSSVPLMRSSSSDERGRR